MYLNTFLRSLFAAYACGASGVDPEVPFGH